MKGELPTFDNPTKMDRSAYMEDIVSYVRSSTHYVPLIYTLTYVRNMWSGY